MSTGFSNALSRIGHSLIKRSECLKANLAFASASSGSAGYLSVGLITGIGTISSYVIEWRRGSTTGPVVLTTGYNPNQTVNAIHPFANEPVQSGNLYAVIKYITIDGIKYSPHFRQGQFSPDLKICFNYVNVGTISCGGVVPDGQYTHNYSYNNAQDPSINAARSIKFDLNTDGSVKAMAVYFYGDLVADEIKVKYVKASDINNPITIEDWAIGQNITSTDYTTTPRKFKSYSQRIVANFSHITYELGDYLIIEVIPRIYEPSNTNTNWTLSLRCLTNVDKYNAPVGAKTIDISTISFVWNSTLCRYELTYKNLADYTPNTVYSYLPLAVAALNNAWISSRPFFKVYLYNSTSGTGSNINGYSETCNVLNGSVTITKTSNILSLVFTNATDYNYYKTKYQALVAHANWADYVADDTNPLYFKSAKIFFKRGTACGDAGAVDTFWIHPSNVINFNDGSLTLTITLNTITNNLPVASCNTIKANADSAIVNSLNSTLAIADFSRVYTLHMQYPFTAYKLTVFTTVTSQAESYNTYIGEHINVMANVKPDDWNTYPNIEGNTNYVGIRLSRIFVEITNMSDAVNNFKVSNKLNEDGTLKATYELVYEKQNGVQVYP